MVKIEIEYPEKTIEDLQKALRTLREVGAPEDTRRAISKLLRDIRTAHKDIIAGETL